MTKKPDRPNYDKWPRPKLKVTEIFLDPNNIRLPVEANPSQDALISDLLLNENGMQIVESIVYNDFFPDEVPVVVKEGGKYIVIDGNRRVSALKVLARPEIVRSKESAIRDLLAKAGRVPKEINVVVAPSRDKVQHLVATKHTQITRRPWKPLRQAYFYKAQLESGKTVDDLRDEYPWVNIDRLLKYINIHKLAKSISYDDERTERRVNSEKSFPITTMERLYDDEDVRKTFGLKFDDKCGVNTSGVAKGEFIKGFRRIVEDVVNKVVNSRSLNNKANIDAYIKSLPPEVIPQKTKGAKKLTGKDFKEKAPHRKTPTKNKLAPKDIVFSQQVAGVRRMLEELQIINYQINPIATHDLLRSFLECSLKAYFHHLGIKLAPRKSNNFVSLNDVLAEFLNKMRAEKNKELAQVTQRIISSDQMISYSAQFLNATNHNPSVFPTATEVKEAWDALEPLFRFILDPK